MTKVEDVFEVGDGTALFLLTARVNQRQVFRCFVHVTHYILTLRLIPGKHTYKIPCTSNSWAILNVPYQNFLETFTYEYSPVKKCGSAKMNAPVAINMAPKPSQRGFEPIPPK